MDRPTIGFQLHRERMEKLPEDRSNLFIRDRRDLLPTSLRVSVPRMDRWIDSWRSCGSFQPWWRYVEREGEKTRGSFFAWSSKLKLEVDSWASPLFFSCLFEIFALFLLIFPEERMFQPLDHNRFAGERIYGRAFVELGRREIRARQRGLKRGISMEADVDTRYSRCVWLYVCNHSHSFI